MYVFEKSSEKNKLFSKTPDKGTLGYYKGKKGYPPVRLSQRLGQQEGGVIKNKGRSPQKVKHHKVKPSFKKSYIKFKAITKVSLQQTYGHH